MVLLSVAGYVGIIFGWHPIPSTALGRSLHKRFHSFSGSPVTKSENLGLATDCLEVTTAGREGIVRDDYSEDRGRSCVARLALRSLGRELLERSGPKQAADRDTCLQSTARNLRDRTCVLGRRLDRLQSEQEVPATHLPWRMEADGGNHHGRETVTSLRDMAKRADSKAPVGRQLDALRAKHAGSLPSFASFAPRKCEPERGGAPHLSTVSHGGVNRLDEMSNMTYRISMSHGDKPLAWLHGEIEDSSACRARPGLRRDCFCGGFSAENGLRCRTLGRCRPSALVVTNCASWTPT